MTDQAHDHGPGREPTGNCCERSNDPPSASTQAAAKSGCCSGAADQAPSPDQSGAAAQKVTDPVCGMSVNRTTAAHRADHDGEEYYFCSARCRAKFVADPDRYVANHHGGQSSEKAPPSVVSASDGCCG